jgi:predicted RNA methylase
VIYETVVTLGSFLMKLFGIKNKDHIHLLFQLNFLKCVSDCMASVRCRVVMDPFVGIGSTALASLRLGVSFIGFDIDKSYLEVCKERVRGI